jgi:hypothetical protein
MSIGLDTLFSLLIFAALILLVRQAQPQHSGAEDIRPQDGPPEPPAGLPLSTGNTGRARNRAE